MKMKELSNHQRSILQTLTFSSLSLRAPMEPARLITTNRTDFELINRYCMIKLEVW
jgi:hypothetical protein